MYRLYIGNKNYSSWSLRPWVLMKERDIAFEEELVPFHDQAAWAEYRKRAPNGLVPVLADEETLIWDSLAIVEHLAERHSGIWPEDEVARAYARSAAAEMHSGFSTLRTVCGMNIGVRARLKKQPEALKADLKRLSAIWTTGLGKFGGPFLAGPDFSAADAFFCPVAFRVQTYGLTLDLKSAEYVRRLLDLQPMQQWYAEGIAETFRDEPHEAELRTHGSVTEDYRAKSE